MASAHENGLLAKAVLHHPLLSAEGTAGTAGTTRPVSPDPSFEGRRGSRHTFGEESDGFWASPDADTSSKAMRL